MDGAGGSSAVDTNPDNEDAMMRDEQDERQPDGPAPEDQPDEVGAEGGSESARQSKAPATPDPGDDSDLGDTDQHSNA